MDNEIIKLVEKGNTQKEISKIFNVSLSTIRRKIKKLNLVSKVNELKKEIIT